MHVIYTKRWRVHMEKIDYYLYYMFLINVFLLCVAL